MRNEIKILIAAIVVIIIVLVGAFALGGNNNVKASITPTTVAVTATPTPTPVPIGGGQGGAVTSTPVPSIAPTPTPTPTPTPEPESGVKQTEFGYWITYPPLGPEKWSDPKPAPKSDNMVYFSPTSQTVTVALNEPEATQEAPQAQAVVHRDGDLSKTTYVLIKADQSSNMYYGDSYYSGYWFDPQDNPNLVDNHNGTFTLRFDPDVSDQAINIDVWDIWWDYGDDSVHAADSFTGTATLTIIGADAPFSYGSDNQYTLTVNGQSDEPQEPIVQFAYGSGSLNGETHCTIEHMNGDTYNISIDITRSGDLSGTYTPSVSIEDTNVDYSDGFYWLKTDAFQAGLPNTKAYFSYNPGDYSVVGPHADLSIGTSTHYTVGSPSTYALNLYTQPLDG